MKILIATDGSEYSRAAIEKCCEIAVKLENTAIKIVAVYHAYTPPGTFSLSVQYRQYAEEFKDSLHKLAEEHAEEALTIIQACLPAAAAIDLTTHVAMGAADRIIVETAEEWNADLIVVGAHGYGFWGRAMIGSVSDSVIHHAPCSVLVVRKTLPKQSIK